MTAVDPEGRIRHPLDVFHSTYAPDGSFVPAGMVPVADGAGLVDYVDSTTFGGAETPYDLGNLGATETLDLANGTYQRGTLNADCTITVTGFTVDQAAYLTLKLTQDVTGGWALTWDPDVLFTGDDQPAQTPGDVTFFVLWTDAGDSSIFGSKVGGGSSLTIKDEGTPLATAASTIDFVGAGVSASGTGVDKTVTISGAPTGSAGGDLSGTYPNPSVVDDSHNHTAATAPGGGHSPILLASDHAVPFVFDDILQNSDGTDFLYASE